MTIIGPKAQAPRHRTDLKVNLRSWLVSPSLIPSTFSTLFKILLAPRTWQAVPRHTLTRLRPLGIRLKALKKEATLITWLIGISSLVAIRSITSLGRYPYSYFSSR